MRARTACAAENTNALVSGSRSRPSNPLIGHPPWYSMRTHTKPRGAVPAMGSPRSRALSAQKKRSGPLTAAASLLGGQDDPGA